MRSAYEDEPRAAPDGAGEARDMRRPARATDVPALSFRSLRGEVSSEEWRVRQELAAIYRLIAHHGWDQYVYGHATARVPGEDDHFLINPYGVGFWEITASSLVKVDGEGNILSPSGYAVNRAGFVIHSAIHRARKDARCIIHVHTDAGAAVSAHEDGLLPITQDAAIVACDLAYHDFEGIVVDRAEQGRLVADLGDKHYMVLRNHGTLALGPTCGHAFQRLSFFEAACRQQVLAMSHGRDRVMLAPSEARAQIARQVEASRARQEKNDGEALGWAAMMRRAARLDPSFLE